MKYYTQELRRAADPNSGGTLDMWVVWGVDSQGVPRQVAYCSQAEQAEHIKALLEAEQAEYSKALLETPRPQGEQTNQ